MTSPANRRLTHDATQPALASSNTEAAWLALVAEKVRSMQFGVVQIIVHDSRVVQVERTERTRFDVTGQKESR